jgi:uncharacterized RDD family membrane protein YckC
MERNVDVATGESVAFTYELAGLGSRFFAVFIDMTIQIAVVVAAVLLLAWIASNAQPGAAVDRTPVGKVAQAVVIALISLAGFLLFFGYFIFFEWRFAGRTPGKRLLGIRVVRDGGFPLDFTSAVVRNVVRILELGLGFYAVSAFSTLLSPLNRRLGDMAAGTIVVRDNRFERTRVAPGRYEPRERDDAVVDALSEPERDLIRRYADRRASLNSDSRAALAAQIAATVRPKLAAAFEHLTDDDLLVHLATSALR